MIKIFKYAYYRHKLALRPENPKELKFRLAQTKEDYAEAFRLLYEAYLEKGYTLENEQQMRVTYYHLLPTTTVLLALWNDEIIGTMSLIRDNPLGLPTDKIYDLSGLRKNHKVLTEVSALAIRKKNRGVAGQIFHPFIRYMWNYAYKYFGVDYFVISVHPDMHAFYESIYLFHPLKETIEVVDKYDFANKNPAIGEYINVKESFKNFKKMYHGRPNEKNLYNYITQMEIKSHIYPKRDVHTHIDAPVNPDWFHAFKKYIPRYENEPNLMDKLAQSYGYTSMDEMNSPLLSERFRTPASFKIHNLKQSQVVDVSESGVKILSPQDLSRKNAYTLDCELSPERNAKVVLETIWGERRLENKNHDHHYYGFKVKDGCKEWENLVLHLRKTRQTQTLNNEPISIVA